VVILIDWKKETTGVTQKWEEVYGSDQCFDWYPGSLYPFPLYIIGEKLDRIITLLEKILEKVGE